MDDREGYRIAVKVFGLMTSKEQLDVVAALFALRRRAVRRRFSLDRQFSDAVHTVVKADRLRRIDAETVRGSVDGEAPTPGPSDVR